MTLRFLDLFAGIGGMRRGLEDAGMQCVGYVERDKFARRSYEAIFQTKGEWFADDIQTVCADTMPEADIWAFGFPFQDLSVAGKQLGFGANEAACSFACLQSLEPVQKRIDPNGWSLKTLAAFSFQIAATTSLPPKLHWPKSGTTVNGTCATRPRSAFPNTATACSLSDILEATVDERYFLSTSTQEILLQQLIREQVVQGSPGQSQARP